MMANRFRVMYSFIEKSQLGAEQKAIAGHTIWRAADGGEMLM
jgi:hypothetical protein